MNDETATTTTSTEPTEGAPATPVCPNIKISFAGLQRLLSSLSAAVSNFAPGLDVLLKDTNDVIDQLSTGQTVEPWTKLTAREIQVARLLVEGRTNSQIATELEVSIKTVDTHRGHVMKKLGVRNNVELVRLAVETGVYR